MPARVEHRQTRFAICGNFNLVTIYAQNQPHGLRHRRLVIHNQDSPGRYGWDIRGGWHGS
jgi:hypothetical protein